MKSKKILFIALLLTSIYLILTISSTIILISSITSLNKNTYSQIDSMQKIIYNIHEEDSNLYKQLLNDNSKTLHQSSLNESLLFKDILKLTQNSQFSPNSLASTLDSYIQLKTKREKIIDLYVSNQISSQENYKKDLNILLKEYETQIDNIILDLSNKILTLKETNLKLQATTISKIICLSLLEILLYIFTTFIFLFYLNIFPNKEKQIDYEINNSLDKCQQEILTYIKSEIKIGNFPTIKELKFHMKLSHPTLLLKLKKLETDKIITIKKKGRNKHLFLK